MIAAIDFGGFASRVAKQPAPSAAERTLAGATPGIELAFELRAPSTSFDDLLIFYHGGGAHRRAGYAQLADEVVRNAGIAVCLPDVRGHGSSGGERGHASQAAVVWDEVDRMVGAMRREHPGVRIHLGGHSSGAGLLLNHLTSRAPAEPIDGLVLLAPDFGYRAGLYRDRSRFGSFAKIKTWPFLLSAMSGGRLGGAVKAVRFDYGETADLPGCLPFYTVNMANAVTPRDPARQLGQLAIPTCIGLAENDELIDVDRLQAFLTANAARQVSWERLPGLGHLDVLLNAAPFVARAVARNAGAGKHV